MLKGCFIQRRVLPLLFILFAAVSLGFGQDTNATLSGTVTDPSSAAIPGAKLTISNQATGFKATVTTGDAGEYSIPNLVPGRYDLSINATGFQSQEQKGIELTSAQQGRANVKLSLGSAEQTVEVTAETSTINYSDPTIGGSIAPETLQDFPLVVSGAPRSSVSVATMMPGVTTAGGGNAFNARINGGIISGDEAIVDGATTMEGYMNQSGMVALQTDFGMSPDITSEVTVLSANYGAQYGNTTSGQLIIQTKSGGDHFHGAVYEYLRNEALNAYKYGTVAGTRKPTDKENDYGANLGGPIPFLHGAGAPVKGYFYFNWEGFKESGGANPNTLSIPSLAARAGNFGGISSQLYYPNDPAKYGSDAGKAIAFNGGKNQINPAYEDPVSKAFLAALPTPTTPSELNNYFIPHAGQGSLTNSENVYFGRFDFTVGKADHLYYTSWWQRTGINTQSDLPVAVSTAAPADPENAVIQRLNWEHTFTGSLTNHATLGYLNRNEGYYSLAGASKVATVPGVANSNYTPQLNFEGGYSQLGNNDPPTSAQTKTTRGTWAFNDVVSFLHGNHTFTTGFEWRLAGTTINQGTNQGGNFTFQQDTTGNTACPMSSCPGNAAASFYLGAVGTGYTTYYNVRAVYPRQYGWAAHIGDSWRVNPRFNLDYSVRWDYITPFKEKYNRLSFFDPNGSNPGAVTTSGTQLKGRLAFAGTQNGTASYGAPYPETPFYGGVAPRVGFAYTLSPKTVLRAGYGIYFGQAFYPGWAGGMSQDGFNKTLNLSESSAGSFKVPALYLGTGISAAQTGSTAPNLSPTFDNGLQPSLYRPLDGNHRPYSSQWNLTLERQLPSNIALSVSYVGTKGTHLPSALNPVNILNPYASNIAAIGSDLTVKYTDPTGPATFAKYGVSQPYVGWSSQLTSCPPSLAQALLPYPQYCGVLQGLNEFHATSIYHSFQARLERRMTRGLYLLTSFTGAKFFTDASDTTQSGNTYSPGNQGNNGAFSPYDISNRKWAIAPDNVPYTLQVSTVYDLPIGEGKQFANKGGFANNFIGGWQVSPLFRYEYGTPFSFYSSACPSASSTIPQFRQQCVPSINYGSAMAQGRNSFQPATGGRLFNVAAFQTNYSGYDNTGNGKAVSGLYGPSYENWDIALTKNTKLTDNVNLKFMANFFNAFNGHAYIASQGGNYSGPSVAFNTDVSNDAFGTWNGNVSTPRTIQFAARIEF